jgi:hypothetical protein
MSSGVTSPWNTPWKPHSFVAVLVDVAPAAAGPRLPRVDDHLVLARAEPLDEELRLRPGLEDELARGIELAAHVDERDAFGALTFVSTCWFLRSPVASIDHSVGSAAVDAGASDPPGGGPAAHRGELWLSSQ